MKTVSVRFGGMTATRTFDDSATTHDVVNNPGIKAELGYGDSIRALLNGVEQNNNTVQTNGATLVVETRANSKAV